jgi:hypothetical protein
VNDLPGSDDRGQGGRRHIDEDVCLDLLQGLLPPADEGLVLAHISDCPACEALFQAVAAESARTEATMVVRTLPDGEIVLERRGTAVRSPRPVRPRPGHALSRAWLYLQRLFLKPRYRLAGAVALVLAVMLLVLLPQYLGPHKASDLHLLPLYTFTLQARDVADQVPADLRAGLNAYDKRDFEGTIALLTKPTLADLDEPDEAIRKIFLGSALAWDGDYDRAADVLGSAPLESVPGEWGREARWTLYVSLRESRREAAATAVLRALAEETGDVGERARRALEDGNR